MNYPVAQELVQHEQESIDYAATDVHPLETPSKRSISNPESALKFPATVKAVSETLNQAGLKCNPNTLKGRWMNERVLPVFDGLDVPEIKTEKGLITDFGYAAIAEVIARCIQGEKGQKIAPEALREELIDRYGLKSIERDLQGVNDLLQKTKQIKQDSDEQKASSALARIEARSQLEVLGRAIQNLNAAIDEDSQAGYELSDEEKVTLAKRWIARQVAEQEYLQKLSRGEV